MRKVGAWVAVVGMLECACVCGPAVDVEESGAGEGEGTAEPLGSTTMPDGPMATSSSAGVTTAVGGSSGVGSSSTTTPDEGDSSSGSSSTGESELGSTWSVEFFFEVFSLAAGPDIVYIETDGSGGTGSELHLLRQLDHEGLVNPTFGDGGGVWTRPGLWDVDRTNGDVVVVLDDLQRRDSTGDVLWQVPLDDAQWGAVQIAASRIYAFRVLDGVGQVVGFESDTGDIDPSFGVVDVVSPLGEDPARPFLEAVDDRIYAGITLHNDGKSASFGFAEVAGAGGTVVQTGTTALNTHVRGLFVAAGEPYRAGSLGASHIVYAPLFQEEGGGVSSGLDHVPGLHASDSHVFAAGWEGFTGPWQLHRHDLVTLDRDETFGEGGVLIGDESVPSWGIDVDSYGPWLYFVYEELDQSRRWHVQRRRELDGSL